MFAWTLFPVSLLYLTSLAKEEIFEAKCHHRDVRVLPQCAFNVSQNLERADFETLELTWDKPDIGSKPLLKYIVIWKGRKDHPDWRVWNVKPGPTSNGIQITGLGNDSDYWFKVLTKTRIGVSRKCPWVWGGTARKDAPCPTWGPLCWTWSAVTGVASLTGAVVGGVTKGIFKVSGDTFRLTIWIFGKNTSSNVEVLTQIEHPTPLPGPFGVKFICDPWCFLNWITRYAESTITLVQNVDYTVESAPVDLTEKIAGTAGTITILVPRIGAYMAQFLFSNNTLIPNHKYPFKIILLKIYRGVYGQGLGN